MSLKIWAELLFFFTTRAFVGCVLWRCRHVIPVMEYMAKTLDTLSDAALCRHFLHALLARIVRVVWELARGSPFSSL